MHTYIFIWTYNDIRVLPSINNYREIVKNEQFGLENAFLKFILFVLLIFHWICWICAVISVIAMAIIAKRLHELHLRASIDHPSTIIIIADNIITDIDIDIDIDIDHHYYHLEWCVNRIIGNL